MRSPIPIEPMHSFSYGHLRQRLMARGRVRTYVRRRKRRTTWHPYWSTDALHTPMQFYTITEILRVLWLADACHLLEDRCTNNVTAWRDSRSWSKFTAVSPSLAGKDFQNFGPKQNENYSALVEDFNEKQAAEYHSQWEAFNSAKYARSPPEKKHLKLFKSRVIEKFADAAENDEWRRQNTFIWTLPSWITFQTK